MTPFLVVLGLAVAISAAARSTWSPCGLSMLSSLTPLAERGRGHRYRTTAAWFIVGGLIGGCALGATAALFALAVRAIGPSHNVVLGVAALAALIAFASDLELFGFRLPIHHRQVNERWLDQFRGWVYGIGFGFQIGMGLATYIMTAALYLLIVVASLSQSVVVALTLGAVFGLVRGLAVLLGRTITSPETLRSFHRRFSAVGSRVRLVTIAVEGGCAAACVLALGAPMLLALAIGSVISLLVYLTSAGGRLRTTLSSEEAPSPTAGPAPGAIGPTAARQLDRPAGATTRARDRIRNRTLSAR
jgi:MFS family permease